MKRLRVIIPCFTSAVYTLWYMHYGVPWSNAGALSTIGLKHRLLFTVWGILTYAAINILIFTLCNKEHKKMFIIMSAVCAVGMALTLIFRFDYDIMPDYYLHCAGTLTFSVLTGAEVFILFLLAKNKTFCILTAVIMLTDLVMLLIFKENALIETLPVFAGYIMLCVELYRSEKLETARKTENA